MTEYEEYDLRGKFLREVAPVLKRNGFVLIDCMESWAAWGYVHALAGGAVDEKSLVKSYPQNPIVTNLPKFGVHPDFQKESEYAWTVGWTIGEQVRRKQEAEHG